MAALVSATGTHWRTRRRNKHDADKSHASTAITQQSHLRIARADVALAHVVTRHRDAHAVEAAAVTRVRSCANLTRRSHAAANKPERKAMVYSASSNSGLVPIRLLPTLLVTPSQSNMTVSACMLLREAPWGA